MDYQQEVARLKTLLTQEQNVHREFRAQVYSDPEFRVIIERRLAEGRQQRTEAYRSKVLTEVAR